MVAYHYWKCYHKEGSAFQTASLFSVEVDYYHFGTCEIIEGSYFCGDHSCSTYKYIGPKDVVENKGSGVRTYPPPPPYFEPAGLPGPRASREGAPEAQRVVQQLTDGMVNRPDNAHFGEYQKLDGRWLTGSVISNATMLQWLAGTVRNFRAYVNPLTDPHWTYDYQHAWVTPLHLQRNLYAGLCEKRCSDDTTCMFYQESRWQHPSVVAECYLFHMPYFRSIYSDRPLRYEDTWWWQREDNPRSDQRHQADFYLKITNPKGSEPWMHIPKTTSAPFPHPPGREAFNPTVSDPKPPVKGRRLEGVY